jgi:site-specific DNA-methyltransferase (adenine-specific)
MLVITIAWKPLSEGTVAKNVLAHGTGGLNIDACRINAGGESIPHFSTTTGRKFGDVERRRALDYKVVRLGDRPANMGRWPANLILSHLVGCQCTGTTKVKGRQIAAGSTGFGVGRDDSYIAGTGRVYADDVEKAAWSCQPGCPVAALDEQSGDRPGMSGGGNKGAGFRNEYVGGEKHDRVLTVASYGDHGGASRFFKIVIPNCV